MYIIIIIIYDSHMQNIFIYIIFIYIYMYTHTHIYRMFRIYAIVFFFKYSALCPCIEHTVRCIQMIQYVGPRILT